MDHMAFLIEQPFAFTSVKFNFIRDLATLISFIINAIILFAYSWTFSHNVDIEYIEPLFGVIGAPKTIDIFGYIQLVLFSVLFIFWGMLRFSLIIRKGWRDIVNQNKSKLEDETDGKIENLTH